MTKATNLRDMTVPELELALVDLGKELYTLVNQMKRTKKPKPTPKPVKARIKLSPVLVGDLPAFAIKKEEELTDQEKQWLDNLANLSCTEDDPGFAWVFGTTLEIHTALGVAGSPVPAGANQAASAAAFKNWVHTTITTIAPQSVVTGPGGNASLDMYQALSGSECMQVLNAFTTYQTWMAAVAGAGGHIAHLYHITPEGKNRTRVILVAMIP